MLDGNTNECFAIPLPGFIQTGSYIDRTTGISTAIRTLIQKPISLDKVNAICNSGDQQINGQCFPPAKNGYTCNENTCSAL